MKRLEYDASTLDEVTQYYKTRALQLLVDGFHWNKDLEPIKGWGYRTTFQQENEAYESIFVLKNFRGRGYAKDYLQSSPLRCITSPSCKIESFLTSIGKEFIVAGKHTTHSAYQAIEEWYGDRKAKRSQVYFMNHIDEGLAILKMIGADQDAAMGYCLHPIVQLDADLEQCYRDNILPRMPPNWIVLAMEYRAVANAYLSTRTISSIDEIRLSPLNRVNDMLIADKIQNYKDFMIYHKDSHERAAQLEEYFQNWFTRLGLSKNTIEEIIRTISL